MTRRSCLSAELVWLLRYPIRYTPRILASTVGFCNKSEILEVKEYARSTKKVFITLRYFDIFKEHTLHTNKYRHWFITDSKRILAIKKEAPVFYFSHPHL